MYIKLQKQADFGAVVSGGSVSHSEVSVSIYLACTSHGHLYQRVFDLY